MKNMFGRASTRSYDDHRLPRPYPMRLTSHALILTAFAGGSMLPATLAAQGRGGQGGPDNRPEVTFPVNIPPDDAKLQAM